MHAHSLVTAVCTVTLPRNTRELKPSQTRGVRLNADRWKKNKTNENKKQK